MRTTTRTRTSLAAACAAALLALTACGGDGDSGSASEKSSEKGSEESSESGDAAGATEPDLEGIPDVVAEVNGEEVTKDEFVATYQARFQQAAMQAQMGGGEAPDQDELKKQTADNLVDTELLRQEAEERGITATEKDVDRELTSVAKENQLGSAKALLAALEEQGTTEDQARQQLETQILVEGLVSDEAGAIEPSEKELRTLYRQAKQQQAQAGQQGGQAIPPYAKVKSQLEQQAVTQEQGRVAQELVDQLRDDADITINL